MRVKIAVAFFWLLTANPALSENVASQFSASKQPLDEWLMLWTLSLTSKADVLEIQKLTINRGCELNPSIKFPITLKFGQTFTLNALKCNPIEVSIETPNGTQTMTWAGDAKSSLAVQKYYHQLTSGNRIVGGFWVTFITSLDAQISVQSVTPNKGNCPNVFRLELPDTPKDQWTLSFGQQIVIDSQECNPITLNVKTDKGDFDFDLDK